MSHIALRRIPVRVQALTLFLCGVAIFAVLSLGSSAPARLIPDPETSIILTVPLAILAVVAGFVVIRYSSLGFQEGVVIFGTLFLFELILAWLMAEFFHHDDEQWLHQWAVEKLMDKELGWDYSSMLARLYSVFGVSLVLGKVVNGFATALLPFLVFGVARRLFSDARVARRSCYWCCYCVPLLLYGSLSLKESLTAFFLTGGVWGLAVSKTKPLRGWSVGLLSILALGAIRPIFAALVVLGSTFYFLSADRIRKSTSVVPIIFIGGVSILLFNNVIEAIESRLSLNYLAQLREAGTFAGRMVSFEGVFGLGGILIAVLSGLFMRPLVRVLMGVGSVLEGITMLTWYVMLPLSVLGWFRGKDIPLRNAVVVTTMAGMLAASISLVFAGVPDRHLVPVFPLLCAAAGNGVPGVGQRKWIALWWLAVLGSNVAYAYIRSASV